MTIAITGFHLAEDMGLEQKVPPENRIKRRLRRFIQSVELGCNHILLIQGDITDKKLCPPSFFLLQGIYFLDASSKSLKSQEAFCRDGSSPLLTASYVSFAIFFYFFCDLVTVYPLPAKEFPAARCFHVKVPFSDILIIDRKHIVKTKGSFHLIISIIF